MTITRFDEPCVEKERSGAAESEIPRDYGCKKVLPLTEVLRARSGHKGRERVGILANSKSLVKHVNKCLLDQRDSGYRHKISEHWRESQSIRTLFKKLQEGYL